MEDSRSVQKISNIGGDIWQFLIIGGDLSPQCLWWLRPWLNSNLRSLAGAEPDTDTDAFLRHCAL